jgi:vitamin B12 transporter
MSMKYLFFLVSPITLVSPALAEEEESAKPDSTQIVVLASGFAEPREDTGQAIAVVGRERIEQLQAVTVGGVLRTLPGISVARRGHVGGLTSLFVRGGNSGQTLVLIDGVRVNDPSTPSAQFDFGPVLAGNVGRIEVLRGPNSVIWGSQAIGGVVNIELAPPDGPLGIDAALEYGSADSLSGHATISGTAGILAASLGGAFHRTDGISALKGGVERDGSRIYALNGRLKVALTDQLSLDFRGYFNDSRVEFDNAFAFTTPAQEALPVTRNRQLVLYAGAELNLAGGSFRNRVAYTRTDIDRRGFDPEQFSYNNFLATALIDRFEYRGAYDLTSFATLAAGVEHERTSAYTRFELDPASVATSTVTSGYAQLSLRPVQGLTVTGGVRHDAWSLFGGHTTLGGNVSYTPNAGETVLRATYGEGFRAPTFTESLPPFGSPGLEPETSRNLDLGVEQTLLDGRARLGATWFRRRATNQIAGFPPANIERVDTDGLELTLWAQPTPRLHLQAQYTLTNAFNRTGANSGKRLELRPQHVGSVTVDWTTPIGLELGASLTLAGESFNDRANAERHPGYSLVDLRASYPLTDAIELYGRIENLFDRDYVTVSQSGFDYANFGRSAYGGVRVRF